jgi:hypothetical protein
MTTVESDYSQDFEIELNIMLSYYITKGVKPSDMEKIMMDCIEDVYFVERNE